MWNVLGRAGVAFVALCLLMLAWSALLEHNLPRAEEVMAGTTQQQRNELALSADLLEYRDYYRDFPIHYADLSPDNYFIEYYKRPLYGPISAMLTVVSHRLFGVTYPGNLYLILSFYAASATLLYFVLMRLVGLRRTESLLLTAVASLSFAWLTVFSVPESYSLSVCASLVAMMSGTLLPRIRGPLAHVAVVVHAVAAGLTAWIYLPNVGASALVLSRVENRRQWLTVAAPAMLLTLAVAIVPHIYWGPESLGLQAQYGRRLADPHHLLEVGTIVENSLAFAFFGLIAPVSNFLTAGPASHFATSVQRGVTLLGVLVLVGCYAALAWRVRTANATRSLIGALAWLGGLLLFHIVFNPLEVLLYLSVPTALICYIAALSLAPRPAPDSPASPPDRRVVIGVLIAVIVVLLATNVGPVVGM